MKPTDENIIMITAGGIGLRLGNVVPKQYLELDGKPVIEYVIDACKASKIADAVLVVADPKYHDVLRERYGVDVCPNGEVLNISKRNGFDYIRDHSSCKRLVVVEAVRPFVTTEVIDRMFAALDGGYGAAGCARKVTDSLGCYHQWVVNREDYYTINPPEAFDFPLLERCFSSASEYTESIQQLPADTKVNLLFDVPYFEKITYPGDIERAEALIAWRKAHS